MTDISKVLNSLRVPELPYASRFDDAITFSSPGIVDILLSTPLKNASGAGSIVEILLTTFPDRRIQPELLNSCYLSDRAFDSWKRKSNLDEWLASELSEWRGIFVWLMYKSDFVIESEGCNPPPALHPTSFKCINEASFAAFAE